MAQKPEIAFIGLGAMGFGMATNLVKQGYPVTGFDVWQPTLDRFVASGANASAATTPADCVRGKKYIVCMVATAQQAQSVLFDNDNSAAAVPALEKGATLLICSTVPCAYIQSLQSQLISANRSDILLVDAPVSGGAGRAADGTLSIMAAGSSAAALSSADFLLKEMADAENNKLYVFSQDQIGAGSNGKMVHQVLAACQILGASEVMGFAANLGLPLRKVVERITSPSDADEKEGAKAWSWMFEHRTPRMLSSYSPIASALTIILKDTSIITAEAMRYGFPTPMTSVAEQVYFQGLARGYGPEDDSGMIRVYASDDTIAKTGSAAAAAAVGVNEEESKMQLVLALCRGIHLAAAAETMAFSQKCGLDLDMVLDLCVNAAGGSAVLRCVGPEMIKLLRGGDQSLSSTNVLGTKEGGLAGVAADLQVAVEEAQRLKMPLYLGSQALNLLRLGLLKNGDGVVPEAALLKVWSI